MLQSWNSLVDFLTVVLDSLWDGCTGRIDLDICVGFTDQRNRFAYVIIAADELVAVSQTVKFSYDDGRTSLAWKVGQNVDPVVWISLFLVLVVIINMFPVKVCGSK